MVAHQVSHHLPPRRVGSASVLTVHIVAVTHSSELVGSDVHSDSAPGFPIKRETLTASVRQGGLPDAATAGALVIAWRLGIRRTLT